MGTATQEMFDTIIDCIQDALVKDARDIERLERSGKRVNAPMIKNIREDAAKKMSALDFVKTQTEWTQTDQFADRSHHWMGAF